MKKIIYVLLFIILAAFLNGCTTSEGEPFNDNDIKITLINMEEKNDYHSFVIEVKNEGKAEVNNLNLYVYYPILIQNGLKVNPFKVEGIAESGRPVNLKNGEKVQYTVFAPIKEVFGDSTLLDFDRPGIELKGLIKQAKKEIPFEMSRSYISQ